MRRGGDWGKGRLLGVAVVALAVGGCSQDPGGDGRRSAKFAEQKMVSSAPPATPAYVPPAAPAINVESRKQAVASVVRGYYSDLDLDRFESAWARLSPAMQGKLGGRAAWEQGYADTISHEVLSAQVTSVTEGAASVRVTLRSRDRDACQRTVVQRFGGSWQLSRANGRWSVTDIDLTKISRATPVTDAADCETQEQPAPSAQTEAGETEQICTEEVRLPTVRLPEVRLPAVTIPAYTSYDGRRVPARTVRARTIPGRTIPGRTIPERCFDVPLAFAPEHTTVLDDGYEGLDADFSPTLSRGYWRRIGRSSVTPDYTARGFAEYNAAGFPKNQYVRGYVRRDGTYVRPYWRNSPHDGLPTCRIITC